jgi:guanylate kinase
MKTKVKQTGTPKEATKQSILLQELSQLSDGREKIRAANQSYVERHPELRTLMDEFSNAVISDKPNDIIKFGAKWFASLKTGGMGFAPLVFCGPVGAGRRTIVKRLFEQYPHLFAVPIQTTTREAKKTEIDGEDFYFVGMKQFDEMEEEGKFIYVDMVYQNKYGVTLQAVEDIIDQKKIAFISCDFEAHYKYRECDLDCKFFFLTTPTVDVLEERLKKSLRYGEGQVHEMIDAAVPIIQYGTSDGNFDVIIYNEDLDKCYYDFVMALTGWYASADIEPPQKPNSDVESGDGSASAEAESKGGSKGGSKASKK